MSKMPAKKKSCFQITSVTQAQVAATGAADDTESLEDPDESRAEDVSSEIYDMSRAEYEPTCGRSSSEEALNNVPEPEATGVPAPSHIPQAGQSGNLIGDFRLGGVSAIGPRPSASVSVNASPASSAASPAPSTVSYTSRFRVIKLDHGTGEPFRRGRWTCTEFYEKDSDNSRTADGIRHASVTTLDPAADRDSGLGHTGGSAVAPATHSGQGSVADASLSSSRMHPVEMQQQQPQIHHQNYNAFSSGIQPSVPQGVLPVGQNGLPQSVALMPPSAQPTAYPTQQQQHAMSHHLASQSSGMLQNHTEYYQQQQPTGQSLPASMVSAGPQPVGQGHPSVLPPATGVSSVPSQVGDVAGAGDVPTGQPSPGLLQQQTGGMGAVEGSVLVGGTTLQQQIVSQYTAAGQPQPHGLHPTSSGVQNVPAVLSASSAALPNVTTSSLPPSQMPQSRTLMALGMQGLPATGFGHVEGGCGRGKFEGVVDAHSPLVSGKEPMKPFMPESLQLATPTVNSLFGIHIPVDGEADRASGSNVAAIDNKIEQAMDLVKSHLMYAVREEVEVLKEQIKELFERNSVLERENAVLKSLANSEQLSQLPAQSAASSGTTPPQQGLGQPQPPLQLQPLQLQLQAQPPLQLQPQLQAQPPLQLQPQLQAQPPLQLQPLLQAQPPLQLQPQLQAQPPLQLQPQLQAQPALQLQQHPQTPLDPSQQQMEPNVTSA
ncbi:TSC22 domain family protein 2-like isoform X2 [Pungitius pungitius]|uniref:TSC22 domain family protein 2-like isoform X2 n=1 Tax=Pungitius pungitius TaxID=134920 RepID=UPI002E1666FC